MSKYIDAEKLKERVTRLIASARQNDWPLVEDYLRRVIDIIDSLQQEQPEVDLNAEIEKELRLHYNDDQDVYWWNYLKNSFYHFYELGKNSK